MEPPLVNWIVAKILYEAFPLLNRYRIRLTSDFALMGQALATAEGVGKGLDLEFNILPLIRPYIKKLMLKRMGLKGRLKVLRGLLEDLGDLFTHLPGGLRQMLAKTKRGELVVKNPAAELRRIITLKVAAPNAYYRADTYDM